jgi:peptidase E
VTRFYRAFSGRCVPTDLTLFDWGGLPRNPARTQDLKSFVAAQDIFYVGGGNTANLLALWRTHGLDQLLKGAWRRGAVLAGISAGMLCWFEGGVTDSFGELGMLEDGLGLLKGTACPHFNAPERKLAYADFVSRGFKGGYAADDGAALHFEGRKLREVVTSQQEAGAYRVTLKAGKVSEQPLSARWLGS